MARASNKTIIALTSAETAKMLMFSGHPLLMERKKIGFLEYLNKATVCAWQEININVALSGLKTSQNMIFWG